MRFLDTNVLLRYLTRDDEKKAEAALALLRRIEQGEEKVLTSPLVLFETIFTLEKGYRVARPQIRDALVDLISLRGLELSSKRLWTQALDLYAKQNISFADAYNAVYMTSHRVTEIYSWNRDFDRIVGIVRREP